MLSHIYFFSFQETLSISGTGGLKPLMIPLNLTATTTARAIPIQGNRGAGLAIATLTPPPTMMTVTAILNIETSPGVEVKDHVSAGPLPPSPP